MTTPQATDIRDHLLRLSAALVSRGFKTKVDEHRPLIVAKNPAVMPEDDPIARALAPGLAQTVALGTMNGTPGWYWQWSGETRGASPEYQLLAPLDEIDGAAEKIARVLRLVDDDPEPGADR